MLKNNETTYGAVAKIFHWLMFLMLALAIVMGNVLASMPRGAEKFQALATHKSFGAVILMLVILRLLWKLLNKTPALPADTSPAQAMAAKLMHWALYLLMFAQPVSGILMSQASGYPVSFFGLFEFPQLIGKTPESAAMFHNLHGIVWILIVLAFVGHAGAAFMHHFVKKDNVLKQMTWGMK